MSDLNYKKILDLTSLEELVDSLARINHKNETEFKFPQLNENDSRISLLKKLGKLLEESIDELKKSIKVETHFQCICACLNAIRILSRDKEQIELAFRNDDLLKSLQTLAALNNEEEQQDQSQITKLNFLNLNNVQYNQEIVNLSLKSIANLIYNCSYAQIYYSKTSVLDAIAAYVKEFNIKFYTSNCSINMFNLRILFLLTIFNKSLCVKLKENFQILIYLIEIIDQIIKDRLNNNKHLSSKVNSEASMSKSQVEYCYLKSFDIDYLVELLKLLYNLTMDKNTESEEYEAHLMRLVSVLRDLLTCKEDNLAIIDEDQSQEQQQIKSSKLDELHSNIINLLLNMPLFCYEELLIPLDSVAATSSSKNKKRVLKKTHLMKNKGSDSDLLENDYHFEGKNIEAVSIILRYLKKCLNLYLKQNNDNILNIKNPQFVSDHLQPVLLLLTMTSKTNCHIRRYCRFKVLPPLAEDVYKLPTDGKKLRNQLVCLMTDANVNIKRLTEQFLYVLCKENIGRLIKYTGFGNSAGLIADIGFLKLNMSKDNSDVDNYSTDSESSDTEEYERIKEYVNNVTGKYEKDKKNLFDGLSEEQKEVIAHELMCNIDRLSKIGVIKPAGVDENGKLVEIEHVLQVPDYIEKTKSLTEQKAKEKRENNDV